MGVINRWKLLIFVLLLTHAEGRNNEVSDVCVGLSLLASMNLHSQTSNNRQTKLILHHHIVA